MPKPRPLFLLGETMVSVKPPESRHRVRWVAKKSASLQYEYSNISGNIYLDAIIRGVLVMVNCRRVVVVDSLLLR